MPMILNDILNSTNIKSNEVSLSLERLVEFVLLQEAKQVGILYHFTKIDNLIKIVNGHGITKSFEVGSKNGYFSMSRNKSLPIDFQRINGKIKDISTHNGYIVRIALDGNKISEHHKVIPIAGLLSDKDPIKDNGARIIRNSPYTEAEEVIDLKNDLLNIKEYILKVDILSTEQYINEYTNIMNVLKKHNIPCHVVRKF